MKILVVFAVAVVAFSPAKAQDSARFEVASIKTCKGDEPPARPNWSPGRISLPCWPPIRLIQDAYDILADGRVNPENPWFPLTPIEGAPSWANSERYTIDAKTESPQSVPMMRGPIMRALLEDRFQLRMNRETRQVPVYFMTVAKGGHKLRPSTAASCSPIDPTDVNASLKGAPGGKPWCVVMPPTRNGNIVVHDLRGMSLDVFGKLLSVGRPVVNRTDLTGTYDIYFKLVSDPAGTDDDSPAPVIAAVREQLGLRLDPGIGPREYLVIDQVEKPSGN